MFLSARIRSDIARWRHAGAVGTEAAATTFEPAAVDAALTDLPCAPAHSRATREHVAFLRCTVEKSRNMHGKVNAESVRQFYIAYSGIAATRVTCSSHIGDHGSAISFLLRVDLSGLSATDKGILEGAIFTPACCGVHVVYKWQNHIKTSQNEQFFAHGYTHHLPPAADDMSEASSATSCDEIDDLSECDFPPSAEDGHVLNDDDPITSDEDDDDLSPQHMTGNVSHEHIVAVRSLFVLHVADDLNRPKDCVCRKNCAHRRCGVNDGKGKKCPAKHPPPVTQADIIARRNLHVANACVVDGAECAATFDRVMNLVNRVEQHTSYPKPPQPLRKSRKRVPVDANAPVSPPGKRSKVRCSACKAIGHAKSNRMCPLHPSYLGDQTQRAEKSDSDSASSHSDSE